MKFFISMLLVVSLFSPGARADGVTVKAWGAHWDEGAQDCTTHRQPPLEIHRYDRATYVLREGLCATWEAPFMYLLIGDGRALLIDTGDVADAGKVPLAATVQALLPRSGFPLLVVHTHRHLDHRAGDAQFTKIATVVGFDIESVKRFYGFRHWPEDVARIDLGDRVVDVIPTPGHNETHLAFYDERSSLLFSGDFLMPGRLLLDDPSADLESARRVVRFVRDRPVAAALGGHIEFDATGKLFAWQSTYHPDEHGLVLTNADVLALPAALENFNGFYEQGGPFVLIDSMRILEVGGIIVIVVLAGITIVVVSFFRRARRRARG